MLDVECIVTGYLKENCYIVSIEEKCLIVDPGDEADKIIDTIKTHNYDVLAILITHSHFDHVGALKELKKEYPNAKIIDNKNSGDISIPPFNFKIIETPGHTLDSVSYYFDNFSILFTGDFLFKGTIGNIPENLEEKMVSSLNILKYIPNDVEIYPGHGNYTTVGEEKESNPFLRGI